MKIGSARVLDQLPSESPCLGAAFTSYTFDPRFFEDHVLRAVLRLTSDPLEQSARYHSEARRALQITPVAVMVDGGERQAGRRLPYDLLEVGTTVFHPKSALLLFEKSARLMVGSGNLTFGGYGGNTELFLSLDLDYAEPHDAAVLRAFDDHLGRISELAQQRGSQLPLVREELHRRLGTTTLGAPRVALLDSTVAPIMEQFAQLLPPQAVVERIGMLAPFYERDDAGELDMTSVFGSFLDRLSPSAVLEIGVSWENPEVHPSPSVSTKLEDGLGKLWAWEEEHDGGRDVVYLFPTSVGQTNLVFTDGNGDGRRWPLDDALKCVQQRRLWQCRPPEAFAPRQAIEAARRVVNEVQLWLHPSTRLVEGRPLSRPLHAKLLTVTYRIGRAQETLVLCGSANMSRRALLMRAGRESGNVELGVAFRIKGGQRLVDVCPELVNVPLSLLELKEREFPDLDRNHALAIAQATHDPAQRSLVVEWSDLAADLPPWKLTYNSALLAESSTPPVAAVHVKEFALSPASAEVILHVGDREFAAPILVTDLAALPAVPAGPGLGLEELLMLLGRRIGRERAEQLAEKLANVADDDDELVAYFGEGFGPTDVFRAWWAIAEELSDPGLSVPAFRLLLEGSLGAAEVWSRMLHALRDGITLRASTVWFYGAELLRTLSADVAIPPGVDANAKAELLAGFTRRVRNDLEAIKLADQEPTWLARVRAFYARPPS